MLIEKYDPLKNQKLQILDDTGKVNSELEPKIEKKDLIEIYKYMVLSRIADAKAFALQREGRMGTYPPLKGHEAAQVGSAYAMNENDWFFPVYRDLGAMLVRGVPLDLIYHYWMGNEDGSKFPKRANVFPISIPVGSQITLGMGFSWASKLKKEKAVTLVSFGDGATSEVDFHDGLNFAGVFKTPTVFLCINNQWAISVPRTKQSASKTIAQKAVAYGFNGIQVDGNDILAVYAVTKEAVDRANKGDGPTLIEAVTYRLGDHTTADDASRYRSEKEIDEWRSKDPIARFKSYLESKQIWNENFEKEIRKEAEDLVEGAVKKAEAASPSDVEDFFKYTYAEMPWHVKEELEELKESLK
ncbi:MAG: pyruvate dehydrogenase (acetyl-transferring) E1 component subunit alpha [Nitrospinota bacterium]